MLTSAVRVVLVTIAAFGTLIEPRVAVGATWRPGIAAAKTFAIDEQLAPSGAFETAANTWLAATPGVRIDRIDWTANGFAPNNSLTVWYHIQGARPTQVRLKLIQLPTSASVQEVDDAVNTFIGSVSEVVAVTTGTLINVFGVVVAYEP